MNNCNHSKNTLFIELYIVHWNTRQTSHSRCNLRI